MALPMPQQPESAAVKTGGKSAFIPEFFAPLEITGLRSAQRVVLSTCQLGLVPSQFETPDRLNLLLTGGPPRFQMLVRT